MVMVSPVIFDNNKKSSQSKFSFEDTSSMKNLFLATSYKYFTPVSLSLNENLISHLILNAITLK